MLARYRAHGGSLTRAAFLSARNDALANVAIIAAGLVTAVLWQSAWPDLIVGRPGVDAAPDTCVARCRQPRRRRSVWPRDRAWTTGHARPTKPPSVGRYSRRTAHPRPGRATPPARLQSRRWRCP